jgi:hypothetical protein
MEGQHLLEMFTVILAYPCAGSAEILLHVIAFA